MLRYTVPIGLALVLIFAGFGCNKNKTSVDLSIQNTPLVELTNENLPEGISDELKELSSNEDTTIVVGDNLGVAFAYNNSKFTVGDIDMDINPENSSVLSTETLFLGIMDEETQENIKEPYIATMRSAGLVDASYEGVEEFLKVPALEVSDIHIGGVEGRKYVLGKRGEGLYQYIFPRSHQTIYQIIVYREDHVIEKIIETIEFLQPEGSL